MFAFRIKFYFLMVKRMAKSQKKHTPSPHREIAAPKALVPLMQAFHVDSEEVAHSLIVEAAKAISFSDDMIFGKKDPSEEGKLQPSLH